MTCKFHNIRLYDLKPRPINCMVLEPEDKILAVSRNDAVIELWDVKDIPYMIRMIPGTLFGSIEAMCWVGKRLFSTGLTGAVVEWDIKALTHRYSSLVTGQAAWCIDVTRSLTKIAVGTEQGYLNIYSVNDQGIQYEKIFDKQEGRILCCKFDPSGEFLVTGSIETIRVWNVMTGQALHRMGTGRAERNKETIVWCLAVASDLTIISGDSRGRLTFWDGKMGEQLESLVTHKCDILSVCLSQDEQALYCAGVDPLIVSYAKVRMKHKGSDACVEKWVKSIQRNIHTHDVRSLVLLDNKLFSGGVDSYLAVSSYPPKTLVKYPPLLQHPAVSFSQQARMFCLRYTNSIEIWHLGSAVPSENGHNSTYIADEDKETNGIVENGLTNGEKETYLSEADSGGNAKAVCRRLQLAEGAKMLLRISTSASSLLTCCALSPDGNFIAFSTESKIKIFKFSMKDNSPSLSKLVPLPAECVPCSKMTFSPDSQSLITASVDCLLRVFSIHSDGAITLTHTISTDKVLKNGSLLHLCVSKLTSASYQVVVGDAGSHIGVWKVPAQAGKQSPALVVSLPQYCSLPTALTVDPSKNNLIVVYADQKIVEYSLKKCKFTDFSIKLRDEEFGLGAKWNSRVFPVSSIQVHPTKPHFLLLTDDCGVYIINKDAVTEKEVESKKSRLTNSHNKEEKLCITIKKQKHLVSAAWVGEDEAALLIVEPDSLIEKMPPAFVKHQFGAM